MRSILLALLLCAACGPATPTGGGTMGGGGGGATPPSDPPPKPDRAAFETVRAVFQHPRRSEVQSCRAETRAPYSCLAHAQPPLQ
jgi:hypothetical protein